LRTRTCAHLCKFKSQGFFVSDFSCQAASHPRPGSMASHFLRPPRFRKFTSENFTGCTKVLGLTPSSIPRRFVLTFKKKIQPAKMNSRKVAELAVFPPPEG
jgi:hypothetical protein